VVTALAAGLTILRKFGEPRTEAGVDIVFERLGGRVDMRIGVKDALSVSHLDPPYF
jgi:hypothetical protein